MTSGQVALNATTATLVVPAAQSNTIVAKYGTPRNVQIFNPDGAIDVYLGDLGVTSGTGFKLLHGASINLVLDSTDAVYAISASATPTIHFIEGGT